ncbi:MAG: hypothetical protein ACRCSG_08315 [Cellulosilyticaceae bacterium]
MFVKDINFFDRYRELERREKTVSKTTATQVIVVAVIVIATIVTTSIVQLINITLEDDIRVIKSFTESEETKRQLSEIERKQKQLDSVTGYHDGMALANSKYQTVIQPTKTMVDSVKALLPEGMTIQTFDYANGNISLKCQSNQEDKIAQYVHSLKTLKTVHNVSYMGFSGATGEQSTYTTDITITLLPGGVADETQ